MKKIVLLFIAVISISVVYSQNKIAIKKAILNVMYAQQIAWNNGDVDTFMKGYWHSDSLQFIGKKVTYGWQSTLDNYKRSYPDKVQMGTLTFSEQKIDVLSNSAAFVIGAWKIKRKDNTILSGHYTLLFKKIAGKWLIVVDHSS